MINQSFKDHGDYLIFLSDVVGSTTKKIGDEKKAQQYIKKHNDIVLNSLDRLVEEEPDIAKNFGDFKRSSDNQDFILKVLGDGVLICIKTKKLEKNLFEFFLNFAKTLQEKFTENNIEARISLNHGPVSTFEYEKLNFRDAISLAIDFTFKMSKTTKCNDIIISSAYVSRLPSDCKMKYKSSLSTAITFYLEGDPDNMKQLTHEQTQLYRFVWQDDVSRQSTLQDSLIDLWSPKYINNESEIVQKYKSVLKRWTENKTIGEQITLRSYYSPILDLPELQILEKEFLKSNQSMALIQKIVGTRFYSDVSLNNFQDHVKIMNSSFFERYEVKFTLNAHPIFSILFLKDNEPIEGIIFLSEFIPGPNSERVGWYIHPKYVSTNSKKILNKLNDLFVHEWNKSKWNMI